MIKATLEEKTIKEVIRTFKGSIKRLETCGISDPDENERFQQVGMLTIDTGKIDTADMIAWRKQYEAQQIRIKEKKEVLALFEKMLELI